MKVQKCHGGVRLGLDGPCPANVYRLDSQCMPMLSAMMGHGLMVDLDHFAKLDKTLTDDLERITEEVRSIAGYYVNIGSGDQVADLLFKKLGLKQARRKLTKSGDRESTDGDVLAAIQHEHPVVGKILDYKELDKLRGTYVRPMPKLAQRVGSGEWRMFPRLGQTRVPSGRPNCRDPNLLAIPTRTERGKEIRKGFITRPGWKYCSIDLSQIEMRMAAHLSGDENLCNVYHNEEDIYSDFAITAFGLKDDRHQKDGKWIYPSVHKMDHRYPAKTCVLAWLYDVTASGLLAQMPTVCANCGLQAEEHICSRFRSLWTEDKCQDLINAACLRYPGIIRYRRKVHTWARRFAFIWDLFGRILHVQAVRSVLQWVVSSALREVGNFPVQSTSCGLVKCVMAETWDDLQDGLSDVVHPLLFIHDELLFETREDVDEEWGELVKFRMEHCCSLDVPLKAEATQADSWGGLPK